MNASISITTDHDVTVTTRKRLSGTDVNVTAKFDAAEGDAVFLTLHPQTSEAYEIIVGRLTDPQTYDNRSRPEAPNPVVWTTGEILPGIMVTVFVPTAMREEMMSRG